MFTPEQEKYLAELADKGLAEQAEIDARNAQIELDAKIQAQREATLATLNDQAQALIDKGLQDFEDNVVPKIK